VFNIGPLEFVVLALVALIVLGPDRLPALTRDAARMIKTLRELATGARSQLREELGPEFADIDLRNLNPRTAIQRAVLGEGVDMRKFNPRTALQDALFGADETGIVTGEAADPAMPAAPAPPPAPRPPPLGRDETAPYDVDAT
jgi:sec-independent protein translocase protein TatB